MKLILQRLWHRAFQVGIVIKGFDGALEIAGGSALLLTTQPAIQRCIGLLTHGDLIEDPHDFLANVIGPPLALLEIERHGNDSDYSAEPH